MVWLGTSIDYQVQRMLHGMVAIIRNAGNDFGGMDSGQFVVCQRS